MIDKIEPFPNFVVAYNGEDDWSVDAGEGGKTICRTLTEKEALRIRDALIMYEVFQILDAALFDDRLKRLCEKE